MSIFDFFFAEKNPFKQFVKKIERLRSILRVMKEEAHREHFQQLKGHFNAVQRLVGFKDALNKDCLIRLVEKEKKVTETTLASEAKDALQQFEEQVDKALQVVIQILQDAIKECDITISYPQNVEKMLEHKLSLEKKVSYLHQIITELEKNAEKEREVYEELLKKEKVSTEMPDALTLTGTMSNGWKLSIIQKVVRQLGAWVEPAGKHAYKIVIPWASRPHPLSKDLDPNGFAQSLAKLLGIPKNRLVESFNRGELVL